MKIIKRLLNKYLKGYIEEEIVYVLNKPPKNIFTNNRHKNVLNEWYFNDIKRQQSNHKLMQQRNKIINNILS